MTFARGAYNDSQWALAYGIASQVGDAYPSGAMPRERSYDERDGYTDLVWLAGQAALKLGQPFDAMRMFQLYATGARSAPTTSRWRCSIAACAIRTCTWRATIGAGRPSR